VLGSEVSLLGLLLSGSHLVLVLGVHGLLVEVGHLSLGVISDSPDDVLELVGVLEDDQGEEDEEEEDALRLSENSAGHHGLLLVGDLESNLSEDKEEEGGEEDEEAQALDDIVEDELLSRHDGIGLGSRTLEIVVESRLVHAVELSFVVMTVVAVVTVVLMRRAPEVLGLAILLSHDDSLGDVSSSEGVEERASKSDDSDDKENNRGDLQSFGSNLDLSFGILGRDSLALSLGGLSSLNRHEVGNSLGSGGNLLHRDVDNLLGHGGVGLLPLLVCLVVRIHLPIKLIN